MCCIFWCRPNLYCNIFVLFMIISGTFFPILCIITRFLSSEYCTVEHIQFMVSHCQHCTSVSRRKPYWMCHWRGEPLVSQVMHTFKKNLSEIKRVHCPPCSESQFWNQGGNWFKVQIESKVLKLLKSLAVCQPQPWCFKGLIHAMDILCRRTHYNFCCSLLLIKPSGVSPFECL